jgi:hypothetical protein
MIKDERFEQWWREWVAVPYMQSKDTARAGWDAAIAEMQKPQDLSTCPVGHSRAELRNIDMGQHTTKKGDNPPTRATFMCCGACLDQAEAVTKAEAVTVERCSILVCALCTEGNPVEWQESKQRWIHRDTGITVKCGASEIRSLRPDPDFLNRVRLEARLEEAKLVLHYASCDPSQGGCWQERRIADLKRQIREEGVQSGGKPR